MEYLLWLIKILMLLNYSAGFSIPDFDENIITDDLEEPLHVNYIINKESRSLYLNISWLNYLTDVSGYIVSSPKEQLDSCSEKGCDTQKYGISQDIRSILIPEHPKIHLDTDPECHLMPGCDYTINLLNLHNYIIANTTIYIPECVLGQCDCKSNLTLDIETNVIDLNTINLMWTIQLQNNLNLNKNDIRKLKISITQTNSTLAWGDMIPIKIVEENFILNITSSLLPQYIFKDNIQIKTKSLLESGSSYILLLTLLDENKDCIETKQKLKFLVPQPINEFGIEFIFYIIFIVIFILILVCFVLFCPKFSKICIKTEKAISIPLHENVLYYPTDQQKLLDENEIPAKNIKLVKRLNGGQFGEVYQAELINFNGFSNKMKVAVKTLKINNEMLLYELKEDFLEEINTMKKIGRHDNIVEFIGCCRAQEPFMLVMEYVGGGNLKDYLIKVRQNVSLITCSSNFYKSTQNKSPTGRYLDLSTLSIDSGKLSRGERPSVTETTYTILSDNSSLNYNNNINLDCSIHVKDLQNFAYQIANGMSYLEKIGVTHRDLAARNILMGEGKTLKISDFGLSRGGIYIRKFGRLIPFRWCSIEALYDNLYSSKSDVWAFGVVLWEIGTLGAHPYPEINNITEILAYFKAGKRLDKPVICSDQLYSLMHDCWLEDYDERPSFEDILKFLKEQQESSYIDLRSLCSDYVFPP